MNDIEEIWETADCLYTEQQLQASLSGVAEKIHSDLADSNPLALCVMNGGVITAGHLLPKLPLLMELDYIHATRYRNSTRGSRVEWLSTPRTSLAGRTVLIVDDIHDQGITLVEIQQYCRRQGAADIRTVVLAEKKLDRRLASAGVDYVAVTVPDRYVFGFGMDYHGYLRNAPGIYAVKDA